MYKQVFIFGATLEIERDWTNEWDIWMNELMDEWMDG